MNPRGIMFFEPKVTKNKKGGLDGGKYYDPWGTEYQITLDTSYDNKITDGDAYYTTVIVKSADPDKTMGGSATNDNISNVK